jgi:hypothetical protein
MAVARALVLACLACGIAAANPVNAMPDAFGPPATSVLAQANAAATAGDWNRVAALVEPLLRGGQLPKADLAEAHRLAGLAAFFAQDTAGAEQHFLAYLKLDLDGRLDPALVPPEAVTFFEDVRARHAAELRALRPRARGTWVKALLPPLGQFQNGDTAKGIVIVSALGAFAITNVTTYLVLRSWCTPTSGPAGSGASCDVTVDHNHASASLRTLNITSGIGLIATYVYGVYDGVVGYRRRTHEQFVLPYATAANDGAQVGVFGSF